MQTRRFDSMHQCTRTYNIILQRRSHSEFAFIGGCICWTGGSQEARKNSQYAAHSTVRISMSHRLIVIFVALILLNNSNVHGFAPAAVAVAATVTVTSPGHVRRARVQRRQVISLEAISLEDEWSDLASLVTKSTGGEIGSNGIAKQLSEIQWTKLLAPGPGITQVESAISSIAAAYFALPIWAELGVVILPMLSVAVATLYALSFPAEDFQLGYEPYLRGQYDPLQARAFYAKHPLLVLQRALQVLRISNQYLVNTLIVDKYIVRDGGGQRLKRAQELLDLVNNIGPTAIKVGQALSVRGDLIQQEFADALSTLQDRVPPFPGDQARTLVLSELGPGRFAQLKEISFDKGPVASASIGQVYCGFIGDREVAVKCQRPNALAEIALDLHLVREFAPLYQKITSSATDYQSLANEWGRGFIAELDYREEAENTILFNKDMQMRKMNAVIAPTVVEEFSTERILVTEWVQGVRLDQSLADDVPRLCSVALNAYLVMLLET